MSKAQILIHRYFDAAWEQGRKGIGYSDTQLPEHKELLLYVFDLEQRLAAAEAKNTELEKELFVLSSDVIYCGCGHVTAGLQEKAKRIYGKLRESGGEG